MRDVEKMKEKIELSLDNRQVMSLVVGSLVMLGLVFILGVMVGKQLGPLPPESPRDLATLDRASARGEDAGAEPALTFQHDLVRPSPPVPPVVEARAPSKPAPHPEARLETRPASEKAAPKHPDPVHTEPVALVALAPTSTTPTPVAREQPHADDEDLTRKAVTPSPTLPAAASEPVAVAHETSRPPENPPVVPTPPASPPAPRTQLVAVAAPTPTPAPAPAPAMDKKLADAFTAAQKAPPMVESPRAPSDGFTVQVAASQEKHDVDQVVARLRTSSLHPYLTEADIPGKGHWYRVRLGSFKSKDDAERYLKDLKRETGLSAFVTSAR